jgi:hypothetical protein
VFSWLDGSLVIAYILGTALIYGTALLGMLAAASRALGAWRTTRLHHLAQALIPLAGCGVFLGLSSTTLSLLRAEHLSTDWAMDVRAFMLAGANLWSAWLAWRIVGRYSTKPVARLVAMALFAFALVVADSAWWLMFIVWTR